MTRKLYIKSLISTLQNATIILPVICHLHPSEPHRNLIGTSLESHRRDTEGTQGEYIRNV